MYIYYSYDAIAGGDIAPVAETYEQAFSACRRNFRLLIEWNDLLNDQEKDQLEEKAAMATSLSEINGLLDDALTDPSDKQIILEVQRGDDKTVFKIPGAPGEFVINGSYQYSDDKNIYKWIVK